MKIFLDDYRSVPSGWFGVKTVDELEDLFLENEKDVTHISLDNNLGFSTSQGKTFVDDLISNQWYVDNIYLHSSDFMAVDYMKERLSAAQSNEVISPKINVKVTSYPKDY